MSTVGIGLGVMRPSCRGGILLNLDVIDEWGEELEAMNGGKRGSPYDYPDSFIVRVPKAN